VNDRRLVQGAKTFILDIAKTSYRVGGEKRSDHAYVLRLFTFFAGRGVELNTLTLFEAFVPITLDTGKVHEDIIALLARNKTESFFCIKKFDCALRHEVLNSPI
jgi:hypothetical protein